MSTPPTPPAVTRRTVIWRFVGHFAQMMLAMLVGMMLLTPLWTLLFSAVGWSFLVDHPVPSALLMATSMTVGMSLWMAYRRHSRAAILEMAAAMYVSFVVLFPAYWTGLMSGDAVLGGGHVLMIPAMLGAMLYRRSEYLRGHATAAGG